MPEATIPHVTDDVKPRSALAAKDTGPGDHGDYRAGPGQLVGRGRASSGGGGTPLGSALPRFSRLRVGMQYVAKLAGLVSIGVRFIRAHLPPPRLRRFPWLQAIEGVP